MRTTREPYFYYALLSYFDTASKKLLDQPLETFETDFWHDILIIQRALDYLENERRAGDLPLLLVLRSGRTDFRPSVFQNLRRITDLRMSKDGYAHNGCCLCTARSLSSLTLWKESEISSKTLSWLQACEDDQWRVIGKVPGDEPSLMSYGYTASTLEAALDTNHNSSFPDRVARLLVSNHANWGKNLERSLLDTKGMILRAIYRYVHVRGIDNLAFELDDLRKGIEQFLLDVETCTNVQEKIDGIAGTLFWREARELEEIDPLWKGMSERLQVLGKDLRDIFSTDKIWLTEDGSWGYNSMRTAYLAYGWLSFWDYIWAGELAAVEAATSDAS